MVILEHADDQLSWSKKNSPTGLPTGDKRERNPVYKLSYK